MGIPTADNTFNGGQPQIIQGQSKGQGTVNGRGMLNNSISVGKQAYWAPVNKYIKISSSGSYVNLEDGGMQADCEIVEGFARLLQVPDASTTDIKVKVRNRTTSEDITDTLRFVQGTDAVGATKFFTVDTTYSTVDCEDLVSVMVDGTSTTAGRVEVVLYTKGVVE